MGVLSNLHLLLRVPSFARWPLKLHFFDAGVYATWQRWCATANEPLRSSISVVTDFKPEAVTNTVDQQGETETSEEGQQARPWGIHALPLDYQPVKEHVAKGQAVFEFEREGDCVVCHKPIQAGAGLHVVCSNDGCEGVGHLLCWSRHMLLDNEAEDILPIQGHCPKCKGEVLWGDMMKELTLRLRGGKDVQKLLKTRKRRAPKPKTASQAAEL
jgi:structure-specific endonuclease subunit SLX1